MLSRLIKREDLIALWRQLQLTVELIPKRYMLARLLPEPGLRGR